MTTMVHCFGCEKGIHITAPTCPSCGAKQPPASQSGEIKSTYKWSLWSPLMSLDYAGRGMIGMGVVMAFVNFIPLTWIISSLVLKKKAIKDLSPIQFKWNLSAVGILLLQIIIWLTILSMAKK